MERKASPDSDYVPTFKSTQKLKPAKTLFMSPVYVKRVGETIAPSVPAPPRELVSHIHTNTIMEPTKDKPMGQLDRSTFNSIARGISAGGGKSCETSSTQTSKTIIELAKLEEYQRYPLSDLPDDQFSVDSLSIEPEKDLPSSPRREFHLNNWVDRIRRTAPNMSLNNKSKFSLTGASEASLNRPTRLYPPRSLNESDGRADGSRRITSFHTLINLRDKEEVDFADGHLDQCNVNQATKEIESNVPSLGLTHENLQLFNQGSKTEGQRQLEVWHSQIQHGPCPNRKPLTPGQKELQWSTPPPLPPNVNKKRVNSLRSRSLIECKRILETAPPAPPPQFRKILRCHNINKGGKSRSFNNFGSASMLDPLGKKCDNISFMSPTLSSEQKSLKQQVESVKLLMGSKFKVRAPSPAFEKSNIPFTNRSTRSGISNRMMPRCDFKARAVRSEDLGKLARSRRDFHHEGKLTGVYSSSTLYGSSSSCDNGIFLVLNRIKSADFNNALKGLAEIIDTAKSASPDLMMPYMTLINQRLLELLKSPRSHVARTACQLSGHFFEVMKDTRRPEFDDIVNTLLYKTADASKFIRQDANVALDSMVTHLPTFHAVRSVCAKGPTHRNPLVRSAAVRLIICAVVIASPDLVMQHPNHDATRKRIIENLGHFLADKNGETRKYAERLYKIMHNEGTFEFYAKRYLNRTKFESLMAAIKCANKISDKASVD